MPTCSCIGTSSSRLTSIAATSVASRVAAEETDKVGLFGARGFLKKRLDNREASLRGNSRGSPLVVLLPPTRHPATARLAAISPHQQALGQQPRQVTNWICQECCVWCLLNENGVTTKELGTLHFQQKRLGWSGVKENIMLFVRLVANEGNKAVRMSLFCFCITPSNGK